MLWRAAAISLKAFPEWVLQVDTGLVPADYDGSLHYCRTYGLEIFHNQTGAPENHWRYGFWADALTQRGANLKKLADAWQPLYQSLDADQKRRLRVFAARIIPHVMDAVDTRRSELYDEEDND